MSDRPLVSPPRNAIAAFAWANAMLYWAHRWAPTDVASYFLDDTGLVVARLLALLGLVGALTVVVFAGIEAVGRWGGDPAHRAFAILLGASLGLPFLSVVKDIVRSWPPLEAPGVLGTVFVTGGLVLLVGMGWLVREAARRPRKTAASVVGVLVIAAPFGAFATAETVHATYDVASQDLTAHVEAEPRPANAEAPRSVTPVLVLVFDALDRRIAFDDRPEDLALPALDRLAEDAVVAERAVAPTAWTMHSIPAMLTGLPVERAEPSGPADLELQLVDGSRTHLSEEPTLFDRVRDAGATSEIVGFYHPYCRLVPADACDWHPHGRLVTTEPSAGSLLVDHGLTALAGLPDTVTRPLGVIDAGRTALGTDNVTAHAINHERLVRQTTSALEPPTHDVVYAHLNIPHRPAIHDADTGETGAVEEATYRDNLVLVDEALAQVRADLEEQGRWDETAIVLTADHGDRKAPAVEDGSSSARHVPLLVKPPEPGASPPDVERPLSNRVLPELTLGLLEGEIGTGPQIAAFLDEEAPEPHPPEG